MSKLDRVVKGTWLGMNEFVYELATVSYTVQFDRLGVAHVSAAGLILISEA